MLLPKLSLAGADRVFRPLFALAVALPLLLFALGAWYDRHQVREAEERRLLATAETLAEHARAVMDTGAIALALVSDHIAGQPWDALRASRATHDYLAGLAGSLPAVESVFLVDPAGREVATSRIYPVPAYDLSQRDYVRAAASGEAGLYVSAPFRGLIEGRYSFVVTRPTPDRGLVGITISADYFSRFYATVLNPALDEAGALWRSDGTLLVRWPPTPQPTLRLSAADLPAVLSASQQRRMFDGTVAIDGRARLATGRVLDGLPLFTTLSVSTEAMLAGWYWHVALMAVFAVLTSALLAFAAREAMLRARAERVGLERLLTETERREAAEAALRQAQKMEALGRLTGGVAHDFNNLLTAVMGGIELAMRRTGDAQVQRLLDASMRAAQRGAQLTRQMLALSRRETLAVQAVEVAPVIANLRDILRRTLGPAVLIREAVEPGLPAVQADPTQLEVAILNLGINARDAMPQGGTLTLGAALVAAGAPRPAGVPSGSLVAIRVADTGVGMSEEVRRRAAEPFFTTKEVGRGTGLGLSMVEGLARHAGGALTIDSRPGEGSAITLFLPVASAPAVDEGLLAAVAGTAERRLAVLLVDDDAEIRRATAPMLAELGHQVREAADGEAALAALAAARPDIVLTDYAMPGMDGAALAARIAAEAPGLPVLMISGFMDRPENAGLPKHARVLAKPFDLAALAAAIRAAMDAVKEPAAVSLRGPPSAPAPSAAPPTAP